MSLPAELVGFAAGALIAAITTPGRVSGAVFLLPVQLSVLAVPSDPQRRPEVSRECESRR
jgi:hypothetical protein